MPLQVCSERVSPSFGTIFVQSKYYLRKRYLRKFWSNHRNISRWLRESWRKPFHYSLKTCSRSEFVVFWEKLSHICSLPKNLVILGKWYHSESWDIEVTMSTPSPSKPSVIPTVKWGGRKFSKGSYGEFERAERSLKIGVVLYLFWQTTW